MAFSRLKASLWSQLLKISFNAVTSRTVIITTRMKGHIFRLRDSTRSLVSFATGCSIPRGGVSLSSPHQETHHPLGHPSSCLGKTRITNMPSITRAARSLVSSVDALIYHDISTRLCSRNNTPSPVVIEIPHSVLEK